MTQPKHNYIAGKAYKMRVGDKIIFVGENPVNKECPLVFSHEGCLYSYALDGSLCGDSCPDGMDIIGEWPPEPKKVRGWLNVFNFNALGESANYYVGPIFCSQELANYHYGLIKNKRIACIPIEFTEGEGL